jgi:hypothetical protein
MTCVALAEQRVEDRRNAARLGTGEVIAQSLRRPLREPVGDDGEGRLADRAGLSRDQSRLAFTVSSAA